MLVLRGQLQTGQLALDRDLRAVEAVMRPDGPLIYAATGRAGGLSVYRLDPAGGLAGLVDSAAYAGLAPTSRLLGLTRAEIDGQDQLVFGQTASGRWLGHETGPDDPLGHQRTSAVSEPYSGPPALLDLGAGRLVVLAREAGGIHAWVSQVSGGTVKQQFLPDADPVPALAEQHLALARTADGALLVADMASDSLTRYQIGSAGRLSVTDRIDMADGLGLAQPSALVSLRAYGTDWVLVGSAGTGALSVLHQTPDGKLVATDHLLDNRDTRFDGVEALAAVSWRGQVFVAAAGDDDGLSLFTLLPTGQLVHRQTLIHGEMPGLADITDLEMVALGNRLELFVTGSSTGLTQLGWTHAGSAGQVIQDRGDGARVLEGSPGDDILVGLGADTLKGGAGDDILVGDSGGVLWGGSGADRFIPTDALARLTIADFERGLDRLDLSHLPWLRDPSGISLAPSSEGVVLSHDDLQLTILSRDGGKLRASDLWPGGFDTPDRLLFDIPPPGVKRQGGERNDRISGGPGADTVHGGGGHDVARTAGGNDRVGGGWGHDTLSGGTGADTIWGGAGNDELRGSLGTDTLSGGIGNDRLWGSGDNDRLDGGLSSDTLLGGAGTDRLDGGRGKDVLDGGTGDDRLIGGTAADTVTGGAGDDTVWGGEGHDRLRGHTGADDLSGGTGNDKIWGSSGDDQLDGGKGADILRGGTGHDALEGGRGKDYLDGSGGADRLMGGTAADTLFGGAGADSIWGGEGHDHLRGYHGKDYLSGGTGNDRLWGGNEDDRLEGGTDADILRGGAGNDRLDGGKGIDRLEGGSGDDRLMGGTAADTLIGGSGADTFIFGPTSSGGHGRDVIRDFTPGTDMLRFNDTERMPKIEAVADGTLVKTAHGSVLLEGVVPEDLTPDDILLF